MTALSFVRPARRDAIIAGGCFLGGTLLYAAGVHSPFGGDVVLSPWWALIGCFAIACAAQVWRTTAPLSALGGCLVALLADAVDGVSLPMLLVFADLLFTATLNAGRRMSRALVVGCGALAVVLAALAAVVQDDLRLAAIVPLQVGVVLVIPVWWARGIRQQRQLAEAQRARAEQVARIAELDRQAAIAEERSRMARDLHDIVAGQLSAIAIQSEAVLSGNPGDEQTTRTVLRSVRENSIAALREMRAMITVLQSGDADGRTAPARLSELEGLIASARASGLRVELERGTPTDLPAATDLAAYRIIQEALVNAAKHAPGSRVVVEVGSGDPLVVRVSNDRVAPEREAQPGARTEAGAEPYAWAGTGTGLVSMRERAHAVGGTLTAGPSAAGWTVRAELPASESMRHDRGDTTEAADEETRR